MFTKVFSFIVALGLITFAGRPSTLRPVHRRDVPRPSSRRKRRYPAFMAPLPRGMSPASRSCRISPPDRGVRRSRSRPECLISINPAALETAAELDRVQTSSRAPLRPLHCIPIILKDNYDTADMPTTGGSVTLASSIPPRDAFVVRKLREAGAIVLAKANLMELARGGTTVSSLGGQTKNPYDLTRTPGGSSGGTGAAIAASFGVAGRLGHGSVRPVAGLGTEPCWIASHAGLISRTGIIPVSTTQDEAGPITRTVEDAARMLDVMAGYDPDDPITAFGVPRIPRDVHGVSESRRSERSSDRRADEYFGRDSVHQEVNAVTEDAIAKMSEAGATIVRITIPGLDPLTRNIQVAEYETKIAFNKYLASLGPRAPVKTLDEFIAGGGFHSSLKAGLEADARVSDGLNQPDTRIDCCGETIFVRRS